MSNAESGHVPDRRAFRQIHRYAGAEVDPSRWPATMPMVAQILAEGLELDRGVTVMAGENGTGQSTVVEVIAEACCLNPQGGTAKARFQTRDSEPGVGGPGFYLMDEPDAPLSFVSSLSLVAATARLRHGAGPSAARS